MSELTSLELCAGGGGQAIGLEMAGFDHLGLVELDEYACETLRYNRPGWRVIEEDLWRVEAKEFKGVDLVAGGVPCPPFSKAGKQLGELDERNLFPVAIRIVDECRPKAVMFENVRGLLDPIFSYYRDFLDEQLRLLGYVSEWKLLYASSFGVPQLRPRTIIVAVKKEYSDYFSWPLPNQTTPPTVGEALYNEMASNGWLGVDEWKEKANGIAPTVVGGSKKHGGPDLGPTRAKKAWAALGVDGSNIAYEAPAQDFTGMPRLTVPMVGIIQGFPTSWHFVGKKTHSYRQVGNAFPPPVAYAVSSKIKESFNMKSRRQVARPLLQAKLPFSV